MLGSKEPEASRPWSLPLRRSQNNGRDPQVSRWCPHLGERPQWRDHRCQQSSLLEITKGFLKEEALGEAFPSVLRPISKIIMMVIAADIYSVCNVPKSLY